MLSVIVLLVFSTSRHSPAPVVDTESKNGRETEKALCVFLGYASHESGGGLELEGNIACLGSRRCCLL